MRPSRRVASTGRASGHPVSNRVPRALLAGLAAAASLGGCARSPDPPGATVEDSAGVRIVTSQTPAWTDADRWRVDSVPFLTIGGAASPDSERFHGVLAVARLADGRILVGDRGDWKIRIFDSTGRQVGSFGRRGEGPGEFQDIVRILVLAGDTIAVPSHMRGVDLFTPDGAFVETVRLLPDTSSRVPVPPVILDRLADGSWLAMRRVFDVARRPPGRYTDSLHAVRITARGDSTVALGSYVGWTSVAGANEFGPIAETFGVRGSVGASGAGYCYGDGQRYEIACYSARGALERVIRRAAEPVRVTDAAIARYKAWLGNMPGEPGMAAGDAMRDRMRRLAEATPFAATFPFFRGFHTDPLGFLWVNNFDLEDDLPRIVDPRSMPARDDPGEWSVFDPSGRWMGDLTLPAGVWPVQFDRSAIVGMGLDGDDFQQVKLLRLHRGG